MSECVLTEVVFGWCDWDWVLCVCVCVCVRGEIENEALQVSFDVAVRTLRDDVTLHAEHSTVS